MAQAVTQEVGTGVHRYADGLVNWYLVEDGDELTLVDAGWPRSWPHVAAAVKALGASTPKGVTAIVLTHAHPDHLGAAEAARKATGARVHVHRDEIERAHGKAKGSSPFTLVPGLIPTLWRPTALGFVLHATARGFMTPTWVGEVEGFASGEQLDVPGRPRVVSTPGHTTGHVSLHLADRGVVLTGDAIATLDVLTRADGPRLMPPMRSTAIRAGRGRRSTRSPAWTPTPCCPGTASPSGERRATPWTGHGISTPRRTGPSDRLALQPPCQPLRRWRVAESVQED